MALRNARDLYTRRQEGVSLWVVPAAAITASSPDEKDAFFDPAADKIYRHPTFYDVPDGVRAPVSDAPRASTTSSRLGRRRAGLGAAAGRVDRRAPQLEEDVALGQHRARPARPGPRRC